MNTPGQLETTQTNPATAGRLTDAEVIAAQMRSINFAMDAIFGPLPAFMSPRKPAKRALEECQVPVTLLGADWLCTVRFTAEYERGDDTCPSGWIIDIDSAAIEPNEIGVTYSRSIEINASELGGNEYAQLETAAVKYMEGK